MNEIVKKIDEDVIINDIQNNNSTGVKLSLGETDLIKLTVKKIKEIILAEQKKHKPIKTKGDVIRESNESLAIRLSFGDKCGFCNECNVWMSGGCDKKCKENILAYLNQPQEDSNATIQDS